jgi:hypothetical protein
MAAKIERRGNARCVKLMIGNKPKGMEGYNVGAVYYYEACDGSRGRYVRVYHHGWEPDNEDNGGEVYYECCGPDEFVQFFEEIQGA